ncbi:hypothetical protein AVEN_132864-1 [Araneus ventricosus]|uniref:Uncharacterized protein n=1 Tax=Araneus ventricosus TaxID=182803 RepID=A0A4Y2GR18_ARAVE|nr:hypothetical protein AVEN_132864-1 [Araneus ventricosus]
MRLLGIDIILNVTSKLPCDCCTSAIKTEKCFVITNLIVLVLLTFRFDATRGLFWNRPRNFEPRSDDEDDTWEATASPNFRTTPVCTCPSLWILNPMGESVDVDGGHHTSGRMFGHYV